MRVLIVEDEAFLAEAVQTGLRHATIAADIAPDGPAALERVFVNDYDAMVLDRDIPGIHGDEVCRSVVAERPTVRILMLTAARRLDDKMSGFEIGADDYLSKPFAMPELIARLFALNRLNSSGQDRVMECGGFRIELFRREAYFRARFLRLSRKVFAVLTLLGEACGGVISTESLLEKALDVNADLFTHAIRSVISSLRKK